MAAAGEGYPFPTNLDRDQPVDAQTPLSQIELLTLALGERWSPERVAQELDAYAARRSTS